MDNMIDNTFPRTLIDFPLSKDSLGDDFCQDVLNYLVYRQVKSYKKGNGINVYAFECFMHDIYHLTVEFALMKEDRVNISIYDGLFSITEWEVHVDEIPVYLPALGWRFRENSMDFLVEELTKIRNIRSKTYADIIHFRRADRTKITNKMVEIKKRLLTVQDEYIDMLESVYQDRTIL